MSENEANTEAAGRHNEYGHSAFITEHDPAEMLLRGMQRTRKVLGGLHREYVQIEHAEFAVEQLTSMYRDACNDRRNALQEVARMKVSRDRALEQVQQLKTLTDNYRTSIDRLERDGLALQRRGRQLQRLLTPAQRKGLSAKRKRGK